MTRSFLFSLSLLAGLINGASARADETPLRVVATTPDLGSLARAVGGNRVAVTVIVKGPEDAHFSEAKPSFIKDLSEADAYVQVGLDLEIGYAPLLLQSSRNKNVTRDAAGYIDASTAITPLEVPQGSVDRSMGDVHPYGNPHYLLDPINGLKVARLLAERFSALRPAWRADFEDNLKAFHHQLGERLVGATLAAKYDVEKLAVLQERGKLGDFLSSQGDRDALGGWMGMMLPFHAVKVVDEHRLWPYLAARFGFVIVEHLEPIPGVPPTTKHLTEVVERMKSEAVKVLIAAPYYDPRHVQFVAQATGAVIIPLAHQTESRRGTDSYLEMIDYNVRQLADAFRRAGGS